ncbi:hypothetical protein [Paracidovorax anthurii]|uniref:Uncharacterized protein n=1 Tax=Paracidovorax anthurii TaxID=78229 RepID=A0A328ZRU3_9BURK|nr:hypothetical protein [Paracidovorax anthurii]RAR85577.1 hypothetical protein AX018_100430 [Paracidovorax anthurii]WCM91695.1 hypothetical protein M5C99_15015 [Acidovorax sp. NCPPB 2350]
MQRNRFTGPRAFAAFTATVLLAVAATAMTLVPDEAVQAADSLVSIPEHLNQILPSDAFAP